MQNRTLEIGVGLFLMAGVLALLLLALRVSGLSVGSAGDTYKVYAYFDNDIKSAAPADAALLRERLEKSG